MKILACKAYPVRKSAKLRMAKVPQARPTSAIEKSGSLPSTCTSQVAPQGCPRRAAFVRSSWTHDLRGLQAIGRPRNVGSQCTCGVLQARRVPFQDRQRKGKSKLTYAAPPGLSKHIPAQDRVPQCRTSTWTVSEPCFAYSYRQLGHGLTGGVYIKTLLQGLQCKASSAEKDSCCSSSLLLICLCRATF